MELYSGRYLPIFLKYLKKREKKQTEFETHLRYIDA